MDVNPIMLASPSQREHSRARATGKNVDGTMPKLLPWGRMNRAIGIMASSQKPGTQSSDGGLLQPLTIVSTHSVSCNITPTLESSNRLHHDVQTPISHAHLTLPSAVPQHPRNI